LCYFAQSFLEIHEEVWCEFQAGCGGETIGLGLGRRPALGVCLAVVIYDLGSSLAI